jgi:hypothetical protein
MRKVRKGPLGVAATENMICSKPEGQVTKSDLAKLRRAEKRERNQSVKKIVITTKYTVQREDLVRAAAVLIRRTHKEARLVGTRQVFPRLLTKKGVIELIAYHGPLALKVIFDEIKSAMFEEFAETWVKDKFEDKQVGNNQPYALGHRNL